MRATSAVKWVNGGKASSIPLWAFLGVETVEASGGTTVSALPTNDWLCSRARHIAPGVLVAPSGMSVLVTAWTMSPGFEAVGALDFNITFLRPVVPDGRSLICRSRVVYNDGDTSVSSVEQGRGSGQSDFALRRLETQRPRL